MIDDRPVSLAAVEEIIRAREFSFTSDDEFRRALLDVRALPTKPPRELPAPEWTGPDRYQTWIDDCAVRPDDHPDNPPAGFVAIGPWEPGNIAPGSVRGADYEWRPVMMQAWSRPLRRVQA